MRRFRILVVTALVLGGVVASMPSSHAGSDGPRPRVYKVKLINDHTAQPMSPPVWVVHNGEYDMLEVGEAANYGVKEVAENADGEPLRFALNLDVNGVSSAGLGSGPGANGTGPVLPGTSRAWQVTTFEGFRKFSFVAMIGCTNDGIVLVDTARLPRRVGASRTFPLIGYDAGTEVNDEELDHMMPPCSSFTTGSFLSDPTLAENGVISLHPGIQGGADLDPLVWGWEEPIARLQVTRLT